MKLWIKKHSRGVTLLLVFVALVVGGLLGLKLWLNTVFPPDTSETDMMTYLAQKEEVFLALLPELSEKSYRASDQTVFFNEDEKFGKNVKWFSKPALFEGTDCKYIEQTETGGWEFTFKWSYAYVMEGSTTLHYYPDDSFPPLLSNNLCNYELKASTEKSWYWTGGGIGNGGYIKVKRLKPKWFHVEVYLPT